MNIARNGIVSPIWISLIRIHRQDCGVKENILRSLVGRGCSVTCFPYDYPIHKVAHHFDGVFISNGPGDPTHW